MILDLKKMYAGILTVLLLLPSVQAEIACGQILRDVVYKSVGGQDVLLDIYYPTTSKFERPPVFYYTHGGGWWAGSKELTGHEQAIFQSLLEVGVVCVSANYRYAAKGSVEHPVHMRDCVVDARDGLRYLKKHEEALGLDASRVVTFGTSAGGHLSLMLNYSAPESFAGDDTLAAYGVRPVAGVSWFGPASFTESDLFVPAGYEGHLNPDRFTNRIKTGSPKVPFEQADKELKAMMREVSPVGYLTKDSPPMLQIHGDRDGTIPLKHGQLLQQKAAEVGAPFELITVKGAGHGFSETCAPTADQVIDRTVEFVLSHLAMKSAQETVRDARLGAFRDAKFGMFIHWGLYAIPARGEWMMHNERVEPSVYADYAGQFNPVKFDAEEWVRIAKDAGMRYIVITAKHHDGFAMFGSEASAYNIVTATPFKRDPLKELAEACSKEGLGLGFYYSQCMDWYHPGGGSWKHTGDFNRYVDQIVLPQLRELVTGYGPVFSLWFDMPSPQGALRAKEMKDLLRMESPNTLINSRLLYGGAHVNVAKADELEDLRELDVDYLTYADRQVPSRTPWEDWETCMTLNESWGYNEQDTHWKTTEELIHQLIKVASQGGNFLLNVGPTAEGIIPGASVRNLKGVGDWLKVNGESIYGSDASPLGPLPWGRCTLNDGNLYLHVFDWPEGEGLRVPGLRNRVTKASLLSNGSELETIADEDGILIQLPVAAPSELASVIKLEIDGPVRLRGALPAPDANGVLTLTPDTAILGGALRVEERDGALCVVNWKSFLDDISWDFEGQPAGTYRIEAEVAGKEVSEFYVTSNGNWLKVSAQPSGDLNVYHKLDLGLIEIGEGPQSISLLPVKRKWKHLNLRSLTLTPVIIK